MLVQIQLDFLIVEGFQAPFLGGSARKNNYDNDATTFINL